MFNFFNRFKKRIKRSKSDIEPQEVFLDKLAQKKEQELGISERKLEVPVAQKKLLFLFLVFLIVISIFFAKTFQIQIIQGSKFLKQAEQNRTRVHLITPRRGVIYDQNMNQLVTNEPRFSLVVDRRDLPFREDLRKEVFVKLAQITDKNWEKIRQKVDQNDLYLTPILENIDRQTLISLETKISSLGLEIETTPFGDKINGLLGVMIKKNTTRYYREGSLFSHLIGYTAKISKEDLKELENYSITDYIGRAGVEKSYEQILRGQPGKVLVEKNAFNEKLSQQLVSKPQPGDSLVLWLDSNLQKILTQELKNSLKKVGAKKAAAVALNPQTGGVLAMVSIPSFDNNLFSHGISSAQYEKIKNDSARPLFTRPISGQYVMGSTIKPLIAAAGLQEDVISSESEILCKGEISVPNPYWPEIAPKSYTFHDWRVHRWTDLRKAIAESCNVFFYRLGGGYKDFEGLGVERIKKSLSLFGWGKLTQIDLPAEKKGRIPDPQWKENYFQDPQRKIWRVGDTYHLSIGQGDIAVTPLQVAGAFSAIANGGKVLQPQVVKKIINISKDGSRGEIQDIKPRVLKEDFVSSKNLKVIREGMRQAVTGMDSPHASAILLNSLSVKVAAKTGTAETPKENYYHNWITVFAPYNDPQIVLTILIEDVEGTKVAALPVAKDVLGQYFAQDENGEFISNEELSEIE